MGRKKIHKTSVKYNDNFNNQITSYFSFLKSEYIILLLLTACICLIYKNSFQGPFLFDDIPNILKNSNIRLTEITWDGLRRAGFESLLSHRPVANISFALNYYLNGYNILGYHLVNVLIHILTGFTLFYFIKATLVISNFGNITIEPEKNTLSDLRHISIHDVNDPSHAAPICSFYPASNELLLISFFTTFIWLVHPLQTQTVSYIVQRMNEMAAMFYILSLLFYAKARLSHSKSKKLLLFFGCILSGMLSLGSKEIAATLPFFIFLYEWYFFQDLNLKWLKSNSIYLLCALFVVGFVAFIFLGGHPIKMILSTYIHRDFTLWQRVLTEFRVVMYYISLIIFPHPMRLNLLHDFSISNSFLDPITTLFSFIAIIGLIVTAVWTAKRKRLFSFCILWFLGNLLIESSVIGLEIIFEHRTYLPSMFFILMVVALAYDFIKKKWIASSLLCVIAVLFSAWTYQRNIVWNNDVILWEDCVNKSPHQYRQHYNLGLALAGKGRLDEAIKQYHKALNINPDDAKTYYGLGNALVRKGDGESAVYNYHQALRINPSYYEAYYNLGRILSNKGEIAKAINTYQKVLSINGEMGPALYNLSWIYATSKIDKYRDGKKAVNLAEKLCRLTSYQQPLALDTLAASYAEIGRFSNAVTIAKKALRLSLQTGPKELELGIKKRLLLYLNGKPFRQEFKTSR